MTGGAAILARLRAQRAAAAAPRPAAGAAARPPPRAVFLYASQTGTAQEIAKGLAADAESRGVRAAAMSLNELTWPGLTPEGAPVAVVVAASTGDGDPPDNAAAFFVAAKKPAPAGRLAGVRFSVLGLGDSNYTRFMHVPRALRGRLLELGGEEFYPSAEADEVDGLEAKVDPWCDGIWGPLKAALAAAAAGETGSPAPAAAKPDAAAAAAAAPATAAPAAAAPAKLGPSGLAPEGVDLAGVPALAAPRVEIDLALPEDIAARVAASEAAFEREGPSAADLARRDPEGRYSAAAPFWATVQDARLLTAPRSDRVVVHVTLGLDGSGMTYTPGDSIGVAPQNDPALVEGLLARLGLDGGKPFGLRAAGGGPAGALLSHLGAPCSLRRALAAGCDLTSPPRKSLLRTLAEHCGSEDEKRTLLFLTSRGGREAYAELSASNPTLLDLLNRFKSCAPPLAALFDALPPLAPRMYSICCAPSGSGSGGGSGGSGSGGVQFAFSAVTVDTPSGPRAGVATGWLRRVLAPWLESSSSSRESAEGGSKAAAPAAAAVRVPVFLRPSESFGPPADPATPIVMVGPGTGVAPFRGFLQQRAAQLAAAGAGGGGGDAWLYFGCRRRGEDYLFGPELEAFAAPGGALSRLRVAFSRAGAGEPASFTLAAGSAGGEEDGQAPAAPPGGKLYVQHLMAADGPALADLVLRKGARVFVCGDGAAMAKDVHAALAVALAAHPDLAGSGGGAAAAAEARLKEMAAAGAYVRDVWCA